MTKLDTYETVTSAIVAALEAGAKPWQPGWNTSGGSTSALAMAVPRRVTGEYYRGINVLLLWASAYSRGYNADTWMTFKQAIDLGGAVRKGEKSTMIVFFKTITVERENDAGDIEERNLPCARTYNVFNVQQIDGLPARYYPAPVAIVGGQERDHAAESTLRSCGADIREGGNRAFYAPASDFVQMPDFDRFHTPSDYIATLSHELCHWSGHKSRLGRDLVNAYGSKDYAFEELVAEIGAAFVGARLGIVGDHIESHASYIASWLAALKNDKRAIFRAAAMAQAAADLVLAAADLVLANAENVAVPAPIATRADVAQLALAI